MEFSIITQPFWGIHIYGQKHLVGFHGNIVGILEYHANQWDVPCNTMEQIMASVGKDLYSWWVEWENPL